MTDRGAQCQWPYGKARCQEDLESLRAKNAAQAVEIARLKEQLANVRGHNGANVNQGTHPVHPDYGPCDGFKDGGACSECVAEIVRLTASEEAAEAVLANDREIIARLNDLLEQTSYEAKDSQAKAARFLGERIHAERQLAEQAERHRATLIAQAKLTAYYNGHSCTERDPYGPDGWMHYLCTEAKDFFASFDQPRHAPSAERYRALVEAVEQAIELEFIDQYQPEAYAIVAALAELKRASLDQASPAQPRGEDSE